MSRFVQNLSRTVLASLATALISPAYAAVLFTIERIDDTHARLVGSGTLGLVAPEVNDHILALTDPFAIDPVVATSDYALVGGNLRVGGKALDFAYAASPQFDLFGDLTAGLYVGNNGFRAYAAQDLVSGHFNLELTGGATFAAVGTSGQVTWGVIDFANPQLVGEWHIVDAPVDVPEPASLALGAIALASLLAARRATT